MVVAFIFRSSLLSKPAFRPTAIIVFHVVEAKQVFPDEFKFREPSLACSDPASESSHGTFQEF
jgi:hypothetical protein